MKRLAMFTVASLLLLPALSAAQDRDRGRPGEQRPERPEGGRPGGGEQRPGRPERPVTLPAPVRPGNPGMRPPEMRPPGMRPTPGYNRPQFNWRGRSYNPIRGPLFRYPPGYGYRRWGIGAFLPSLFFGSTYYYDDWRGLGIDPPPPGRRWVRYGPDLLLVNLRTRRVEDVIYGAFY